MLNRKDLESLTVWHGDGARTVSVGANLTLYIEPPFTEISDRVLAAYDAFLEICPQDQLSWYITNSMEKHERVTRRTLGMPRTWLSSAKKSKTLMTFEVKNAVSKHYSDTGDWKFSFVSRSRNNRLFTESANYIEFLFPMEYLEEDLNSFTKFVQFACSKLPFLSGHAGYTFEVSRYYENRGAFDRALAQSMRYKEIDISDRDFAEGVKMPASIKGINWLTILNNALAEQLPTSARKSSEELFFIEVEGGLIVQAGELPSVADANEGEFVTAYQDAYDYLKPLIASNPVPLSVAGEFEEQVDKTNKWIHRFKRNE